LQTAEQQGVGGEGGLEGKKIPVCKFEIVLRRPGKFARGVARFYLWRGGDGAENKGVRYGAERALVRAVGEASRGSL
jgi:hypothetical protein